MQENNETLASSSAQGLYGDAKALTQVSGSYKGTGSFSAQAQTSDKNRGAQSQVLGSSDGATSAGQAHGGAGQSQAEVKVAHKQAAHHMDLKLKCKLEKWEGMLMLKLGVKVILRVKHK
jgi:hypothetical protein